MKIKLLLPLLSVLYFFPMQIFAQKDTSSINLNEVVISTERIEQNLKKLPISITVLNNKVINIKAISSIDDALKSTAGVNIFRPLGIFGQSKVNMRGIGGNEQGRVLVLQDGVPINSSDLGGVNWNRISPLSVSKIEVFRGPSSAIYGSNAMGGIINLITHDVVPNLISGKAKFSYGTYNTYSGDILIAGNSLKSKKWSFNINSFYRKSDGYIFQPDSIRDSTNIPAWSEEFGVNFSETYKINKNSKIDFSYNYYNDRRSEGIKILDDIGNARDHDTHFFRTNYSGKRGNISWNSNIYFQNEHYFRIAESFKKSYSLYHVNSYRNDLGFIGGLNQKTKRNTLSIGLDYKKGIVNGADEYQTSTDIIRNIGNVNSFSAYIADNFHFTKKLFASATFHYDYILLQKSKFVLENTTAISDFLTSYQSDISNKKWDTYSPKIAIQYNDNNSKIYLSYSNGFRIPTLDDLTRTGFIAGAFKIANPNLKAEKVNNLELGISYYKGIFDASFTTYYTLGDDFMYYVETGDLLFGRKPIVMKQNITNVELYGTEASINVNFNKNIQAFTNYTFGKSKILKYADNAELENKSLTYTPTHKFNSGISFKSKIIDITSSFNYISEQFIDDLNTNLIPQQYLLNLKMAKEFKSGLELSLSVQNILNNQYIVYYDQLSIGRFSSFSVSYKFSK